MRKYDTIPPRNCSDFVPAGEHFSINTASGDPLQGGYYAPGIRLACRRVGAMCGIKLTGHGLKEAR